MQQEYAVRYEGDGDQSPIDAEEFRAPGGLFLLASFGDSPAGMGGWRRAEGSDAEIKRMFVRAPFRRTGVARLLLAELERTAVAAGVTRMVLGTGSRQPEAVALYASAGYEPTDGFGIYACHPEGIFLAKQLS